MKCPNPTDLEFTYLLSSATTSDPRFLPKRLLSLLILSFVKLVKGLLFLSEKVEWLPLDHKNDSSKTANKWKLITVLNIKMLTRVSNV